MREAQLAIVAGDGKADHHAAALRRTAPDGRSAATPRRIRPSPGRKQSAATLAPRDSPMPSREPWT